MEHAANRPAPAPITKETFIEALVSFIVNNKLAMSIVQDPSFQNLLNIAHLAQSDDVIKLPKKDSFRDKVCCDIIPIFSCEQLMPKNN